eukprot:TRINITY_DN8279_c0_g1_i1.p1 TRINITY_DN8279_c0_g1~~TRINITY_DN8279_c0_g1_i1.p1  ORF type:complete len:181 (+),score=42.92 TRINITY_DN8279_c0_g1_i1:69-611(+)
MRLDWSLLRFNLKEGWLRNRRIYSIIILGLGLYNFPIFKIQPNQKVISKNHLEIDPGVFVKIPFTETKIIDLDYKSFIQTINIEAIDDSTFNVGVDLLFKPDQKLLNYLIKHFGVDYQNILLSKIVKNASKKIISQFSFFGVISYKLSIEESIANEVREQAAKLGIIVDSTIVQVKPISK